jgi:hypothetical protein
LLPRNGTGVFSEKEKEMSFSGARTEDLMRNLQELKKLPQVGYRPVVVKEIESELKYRGIIKPQTVEQQ